MSWQRIADETIREIRSKKPNTKNLIGAIEKAIDNTKELNIKQHVSTAETFIFMNQVVILTVLGVLLKEKK